MNKKVRKMGFTLVELLVVIAIIAMLLAILLPALGKVKQLAQRIMCGTNIGGIGKSMLTYVTDDKYESYPIAGPSGTLWDLGTQSTKGGRCNWDWSKKAKPGTTGTDGNPCLATPCRSTLSACLYLLVKYADVSPDQFICPGGEEKKFEFTLYTIPTTSAYGKSYTEFWDFGGRNDNNPSIIGRGHNSYSYQLPLPLATSGIGVNAYPITSMSSPRMAIVADRNPFFDYARNTNPGAGTPTGTTDRPNLYDWQPGTGNTLGYVKADTIAQANATAHQQEGQNVLFVDQHVKFEKSANCGVEQDNIYTTWGYNDSEMANQTVDNRARYRQCGRNEPTCFTVDVSNWPQSKDDNFLVNEFN